jgi:hypothetical protein
MRQQFDIILTSGEGEKAREKTYKVICNFGARKIIDARLGGPLEFFLRHHKNNFRTITISEIVCFVWAMLQGSGYDISEDEIGEYFNDLGEVEALGIVLPILTHWISGVDQAKKKTAPLKNSASPKKHTK